MAQYDAGQDETTIVNHIVYDSFGREVSETDDTLDVLDLGYTGRWLDRATGLQWNLHRWYNATIGRRMSEDPIGFAAGDANMYRYVGNSPTNMIDPSGLNGKKTVETGIKGIKFFIEWLPNRGTGEIKILTKRGVELAIAKWVLNPATGELTCNVVATHGKKVLPGVAQSTLKKITPMLIAEMSRNVQRIGGTWVITRLADSAKTGGRVGLGRVASTAGGFGLSTIIAAFMAWVSLENTCDAGSEIRSPIRQDIDLQALGLTDQELLELSEALEAMLLPED